MKKHEALKAAAKTVEKRGESYGDVRENHQRIASLWSVVLGQDISPEQVVLCMTCVKVARLIQRLIMRIAGWTLPDTVRAALKSRTNSSKGFCLCRCRR